ncbi:FAD-dependent oxidoreductase [Falsirhodobacter sp. alg1]|uniref:FAD-dependent oxidoreductase n=1 Tax=Falsirhodobacter sp. alg1 TaxID=1472418 RepID=UPI0005F0A8AB|nr:FAD-dependent oxidoreductase [Falsirhodobacter sp. alg1]
MHKAIILGAGIAGLATARALALRGWDVQVYEQAPALTDIGAGLQIGPNGARVLAALGLDPHSISVQGQAVELHDGPSGRRILRMPLGNRDWHMLHRADLIGLLADGAREAGVTIRLGQRGGPELAAGGLLIGADGVHSQIRHALNGITAPQFSGHVAWRAVISGDTDNPVAQVHMGPKRHLVSYPLRGGQLRNIVAVEERTVWAEESWSSRDESDDLQRAFATFGPSVRSWLAQVERPWVWGLFLHPVATHWYGQGMCLVGDAAHPTLPFMAQGANMALEDAWILADCLDRMPQDIALREYQAARQTRCRRIVAAAASNADTYHAEGLKRRIMQAAMAAADRVAPQLPLKKYDWLYRYDPVQAASSIQTGT